jgi:hypothetical protein
MIHHSLRVRRVVEEGLVSSEFETNSLYCRRLIAVEMAMKSRSFYGNSVQKGFLDSQKQSEKEALTRSESEAASCGKLRNYSAASHA